MDNNIYLSVIIPAYNESKRICPTLEIISNYLETEDFTYEIIVVDDGSKDDTKEVVENLKTKNLKVVRYEINRGKGYAVHKGVEIAKGKYVVFADSDNSTPFEEIDKLMPYAEQFNVVIGSRYLKNSNIKIKQPFYRILIARLGNLLIQTLLLPGIPDTQCGFKLFESAAAKKIFAKQTIWRWGFDIEVLRIAKEQKYKIKQVPVVWVNNEASRVNSGKMFFKTLNELFQIRLNSFLRRYKG